MCGAANTKAQLPTVQSLTGGWNAQFVYQDRTPTMRYHDYSDESAYDVCYRWQQYGGTQCWLACFGAFTKVCIQFQFVGDDCFIKPQRRQVVCIQGFASVANKRLSCCADGIAQLLPSDSCSRRVTQSAR